MHRSHARPRALCALCALGLLLAACAPPPPAAVPEPVPAAAPAAESGAFVARMGTDTLYVERFTRTPERITGEVVVRTPVTATRRYTARLRPDGTLADVRVVLHTLGRPEPLTPYAFTLEFGADSATVRYERDDTVTTRRVAVEPGALPYLRGSYAIYEQAIRQARAAGGGGMQLLAIDGSGTLPLEIRPLGPDSVLLTDLFGPARVRVDAAGRLLGLDAMESTQKVVVERVPDVDVPALAAGWAERDRAGAGLGTLSPRDSVSARIGGAALSLAYGRPSARGRTVLGGLIPWNQVWRTGANLTTHLRTDRDLEIGGVEVPAGVYSLFTLASPSGWTLILNRKTGVSGTQYDPAQDLARVPLRVETVAEPVERFTMALEPRGEGGVLRMEWGSTGAWVPFTVR